MDKQLFHQRCSHTRAQWPVNNEKLKQSLKLGFHEKKQPEEPSIRGWKIKRETLSGF